jgi:hypothetical protein
MYGGLGLFGDLPEAKNSKKADGDADADKPATHSEGDKAISGNSENVKRGQINVPKQAMNAQAFAPRPSVLKGPGAAAGSTVAFIPAAARSRKKAQTTSTTKNTARTSEAPPPASVAGSLVVSTYTTHQTIITTAKEPAREFLVSSVHESDQGSIQQQEQEKQQHEDFVEPEFLRCLHEKALADPYDPLLPNDLLTHWARKTFEHERINLEPERQRTLKQQDRLREQLKKEREELARSGDVQQLVDHHSHRAMGSGRGRGVSNLPAWLLNRGPGEVPASKKQKN